VKHCPICDELIIWGDRHVCKPAWRVWNEDDPAFDADRVFASNAQAAAEVWAEKKFYRGWYEMRSVDVYVVADSAWDEEWAEGDPLSDGMLKYEVNVEMVPSFAAERIVTEVPA